MRTLRIRRSGLCSDMGRLRAAVDAAMAAATRTDAMAVVLTREATLA
jgi:hypothetical protein